MLKNPPQSNHRHVEQRSPAAPTTFAEYVASLPAWESKILQYAEFVAEPFEFCVDLQPQLRAVSDGSVRHGTQGAFGWSMRNEFGATVASGMGPARGGGVVTSYRAEAYGMLSMLRFLIRMAEFAKMQLPLKGIVATDNQSLLDTLFGHDEIRRERERDEPANLSESKIILDCLAPDWDVVIKIQDALNKLPHIKLEHVKGHQDRDRQYYELDEMGQLIVDADAKARAYQDAHGAARPLVPMMTSTRAHLVGPHGTITGNYADYLRYQATAPSLRAYILKKYSWSEPIMSTINWEAHRLALGRMFKRRTHYTKLVFDILPTTSLLNKYDNGRRRCPSCNAPHEDRDHVLRCRSSRRVTWRIAFMDSLTDFCRKTQTDGEIQTLLRVSFELWFSTADESIQLQSHMFSPRLHGIIQQQNAIGWRQVFNGRFGGEWSRVQQAAYNSRPRSGTDTIRWTGEKWQVQLIIHIWNQWESAWAERNQALHGNTATEKSEAIRQEVRCQLDIIYQNRHLLESSVQELLCDQQEEHERQNPIVTRNWLAQNARLFKESIRRARQRATRNVRSIRSYFQTASGR